MEKRVMTTEEINGAVANLYRFEVEWDKKVAQIAAQRDPEKVKEKKDINFCELNNLAIKVLNNSVPQSTLLENMPVLSNMSKETCTERHKMYFECAIIYGTYKKREEELIKEKVEKLLKEMNKKKK